MKNQETFDSIAEIINRGISEDAPFFNKKQNGQCLTEQERQEFLEIGKKINKELAAFKVEDVTYVARCLWRNMWSKGGNFQGIKLSGSSFWIQFYTEHGNKIVNKPWEKESQFYQE